MSYRRPWSRQQQRWQAFLDWLGIRNRTSRRRHRLSIAGVLGERLEPRWMLSGSPPQAVNNTYFVDQGATLDVAGVLPAVDPIVYVALNGATDELRGVGVFTQGDALWSALAPSGLTGSLSLSGTGGGSVVTDTVNTDPNAISVAAWIRPTRADNTLQALVTQTGTSSFGVYLSDYNNGLTIRAPGAYLYYDAIPTLDQWTHIAVSYEQATQEVQLYVNGQAWAQPPVADLSVLSPATSAATISAPLVIGSDQAGSDFSGQIAAVGWWNTTLEATQAAALAAAPSVLLNDADSDGDPLSAVLVNDVTQGTLNLQTDGTFSYTPPTGFFGTTTFTYLTFDGSNSSAPATVSLVVQGEPLVTLPAPASVDEDTPLAISGLQIDHGDEAPLSVTLSVLHGSLTVPTDISGGLTSEQVIGNGAAQLLLVGSAEEIAATLDANNGLVYEADAGYSGTDALSVTAEDDMGSSPLATLAITIDAINDAPQQLFPTSIDVAEDTVNEITDLAIVDDDTWDVVVTLSVAHGELSLATSVDGGLTAGQIAGNGSATVSVTGTTAAINATLAAAWGITYRPDDDYHGSDTLTMTTTDVGDDDPLSDTDALAFTVSASNDPPHITVPNDVVQLDLSGEVFVTGISLSDIDAGSDDVQVTLHVAHGSLTLNAAVSGGVASDRITGNGAGSVSLTGSLAAVNATLAAADGLKYLVSSGYIGFDTVTITANDLGHSGGAPQTDVAGIQLRSGNQPPVNSLPAAFSGDEDTPIWLTGIAVSDIDTSGEDVFVTLSVVHGSLTLATAVSGGVTGGQIGTNGTATITITAPLAAINTTLTASSGLGYLASAYYHGTDALTVETDDLGSGPGEPLVDIDTAAVTVNSINNPPTFMLPTPLGVNEDTLVYVSGLVVSDVDAAGGPLRVTLSVLHGSLTLNSTVSGGIPSGQISGNGGASVTISGTLTQINTTLADAIGVSYLTAANYDSTDQLTLLTNDLGNSGAGGSLTATDTMALTINPINDAPTNELPAAFGGDEDTTIWMTGLSVSDIDSGSLDLVVVLSVEHGTLTLDTTVGGGLGSSQVTGNGSTALSMTGSRAAINITLAATHGLGYQAVADYAGTDALHMVTNDLGHYAGAALTATASAALSVSAVNDAPTVSLPSLPSTSEDTPFNLTGVSLSDIDASGSNLFVTLSVAHGSLSLSSTVSGGINSVTNNGSSSLSFCGTLSQINTTLADAAGLSYLGSANSNGNDTFTVLANDLGNTGNGGAQNTTATLPIIVNAVNDAPVTTVPGSQTASEDTTLSITGISVNDLDAGSSPLQLTLAVAHGAITVNASTSGAVVANNNSASVTLSGTLAQINTVLGYSNGIGYQGSADYNGSDLLSITTNDLENMGSGGAQTDLHTIGLTVSPVNDGPTFSLTSEVVNEDTTTVLSGLSVNDVDAGNSTLRVTLGVAHGVLTLATNVSGGLTSGMISNNGTASVSFTATLAQMNNTLAASTGLQYLAISNYNGTEILTLTANDVGNSGAGGAQVTTSTQAITVNAINDGPSVAVPGPSIINASTSTAMTGISVSDIDAGSNNILMTVSALHGSLTLSSTVSGGITSSQIGTNGSASVTITAPLSAINATFANSHGLKYLGSSSYSGSDKLTVSINDLGSTDYRGTSAPLTHSDTVGITLLSSGYSLSGTALTITGSSENDAMVVSFSTANSITTSLNGIGFAFDLSRVNTVSINLGAGSDSSTITGRSGLSDTVSLFPYSRQASSISSSTGGIYSISLANSENIFYYGDAGDIAYFNDSSGNDTFTSTPASSTATMKLSGASSPYSLMATGAGTMYAYGNNAGTDTANMYDSSGNDTFSMLAGTGGYSIMSAATPAYLHEAIGFSNVTGTRLSGGTDIAAFYGNSLLDDHFDAFPNATTSSGYSRMYGTGYDNKAYGFTTYNAFANAGGNDIVNFNAVAGVTDTFYGTPGSTALLTSSNYTIQGYYFRTVYAWGNTSDSGDIMHFNGTAGVNDTFSGVPGSTSSLTAGSNSVNGLYFTTMYAWGNSETGDTCTIWDSNAIDVFQGVGSYDDIIYSIISRSGVYLIQVLNFDSTTAISAFGGSDTAYLFGGSGADSLVLSGSNATMTLSNGRKIITYGFATLWANPGTGSDVTRSGTYAGTYYGSGVWA